MHFWEVTRSSCQQNRFIDSVSAPRSKWGWMARVHWLIGGKARFRCLDNCRIGAGLLARSELIEMCAARVDNAIPPEAHIPQLSQHPSSHLYSSAPPFFPAETRHAFLQGQANGSQAPRGGQGWYAPLSDNDVGCAEANRKRVDIKNNEEKGGGKGAWSAWKVTSTHMNMVASFAQSSLHSSLS